MVQNQMNCNNLSQATAFAYDPCTMPQFRLDILGAEWR